MDLINEVYSLPATQVRADCSHTLFYRAADGDAKWLQIETVLQHVYHEGLLQIIVDCRCRWGCGCVSHQEHYAYVLPLAPQERFQDCQIDDECLPCISVDFCVMQVTPSTGLMGSAPSGVANASTAAAAAVSGRSAYVGCYNSSTSPSSSVDTSEMFTLPDNSALDGLADDSDFLAFLGSAILAEPPAGPAAGAFAPPQPYALKPFPEPLPLHWEGLEPVTIEQPDAWSYHWDACCTIDLHLWEGMH